MSANCAVNFNHSVMVPDNGCDVTEPAGFVFFLGFPCLVVFAVIDCCSCVQLFFDEYHGFLRLAICFFLIVVSSFVRFG